MSRTLSPSHGDFRQTTKEKRAADHLSDKDKPLKGGLVEVHEKEKVTTAPANTSHHASEKESVDNSHGHTAGTASHGTGSFFENTKNKAFELYEKMPPVSEMGDIAAEKAETIKRKIQSVPGGMGIHSAEEGMAKAQNVIQRARGWVRNAKWTQLAFPILLSLVSLYLLNMMIPQRFHLFGTGKNYYPSSYDSSSFFSSSPSYSSSSPSPWYNPMDWANENLHDVVNYAQVKSHYLKQKVGEATGMGGGAYHYDEAVWKAKDSAAEAANKAFQLAMKKAGEARDIAAQKTKEALDDIRRGTHDATRPNSYYERLMNQLGDWKDSFGRRASIWAEDQKHKANEAAEEARHQAASAKLHTEDSGIVQNLKHKAEDFVENVKDKLHHNTA